MKVYKLTFRLSLAVLFCIVACGGDDENDDSSSSSSPIVGCWGYSNVTYVFESDKTGYYEIDMKSEGLGVRRDDFTWKCSATQLFLSYDGNGDTNKGTYMYYYTLVDDVLTLFYDDGEYKGAYKRQ